MRWGVCAGIAMVLATGVASAQTTPPASASGVQAPAGRRGQRAQQGAVPPAVALSEVQDVLDGYILKQSQTALKLTDAQFAAFFPKMLALQKLRRQHQRARLQLINQINLATKPGSTAEEATLASQVKAVDDLEAQMATDERAALAAIDSVLTVFQRARFRVFEENMEKEKIRLIAKVMNDSGNGGDPVLDAAPAPVPKRGGGHR